jgi:cyclic pyranopterin phosphate synthase
MDVGGATGWTPGTVVSRAEILERIVREHGPVEPTSPPDSRAPAERFRLRDGTTFGIIASTTVPFCRTCDRSRVTADGTWFLCLYAADGVDLRALLREGMTDADIADRIRAVWEGRSDRGAEMRARMTGRGALYAIEGLRADPRREMHTRGG